MAKKNITEGSLIEPRTFRPRTRTVSVWCSVFLFFVCMDSTLATTTAPTVITSDELTAEEVSMVEKGMRPFFDMVKSFLGVVQPHKISEQSWLNMSALYSNNKFHTEQLSDWRNWVTYLIGFVICAAIGLLFFVVMPITGLIFCCCRCCGKCGAKHKPHDPKRAGCKRKSYCTVLLLLNTITLAGVVCAFLSNDVVYSKLRNQNDQGPTGKLTSAIDDINKYTNSTVVEIVDATVVKFDFVKNDIIKDVKDTAKDAVQDVLASLNATALLTKTKELSKVVNKTRDELLNVGTQLATLQANATYLTGELINIADTIEAECARKIQVNCNGFNRGNYQTSANFSSLGDLSQQANNVSNALDLGKYINEAEENIESTKNTTSNSVDNGIQSAMKSVDDVRMELNKGIEQVRSTLNTEVIAGTSRLRSDLTDSQSKVSDNSKYVWYGGLAISCALLLVVVLYYVGVLFGLCGERPGIGAQCCNTGTGSNFLMAGVGFTFLFAWLIMLVIVILFVTGGVVHTEVCQYFDKHEPQALKPFNDLLMQVVQPFKDQLFNNKDVNLSMVTILNDCKANKPIYGTMQLDNMVNISQYANLGLLQTELDKLKNQSFTIPDLSIVTPQLNSSMRNFINAGLDNIDFNLYYAEVNKNLTVVSLQALAEQVRSLAKMPYGDEQFKNNLTEQAVRLEQLYTGVNMQMKAALASLNASLRYLDEDVKPQIMYSTNNLLEALQESQNNFNQQKNQLVPEHLAAVIQRVLAKAQRFIDGMLGDVHNNIGKCKPVYDSFYSISDAVCVAFLEPVNGFWFSVGWCLFFFVPCLIFAVKLAGLYRREHDEKDFDDPNYIMYAGNQDTIPLTSVDAPYQRSHAYPGHSGGAANSAYQRDSYLGPADKHAPPPYSAPRSNGSAALNGRISYGGSSYEPGYDAYDANPKSQRGSYAY